MEKEQIMVDTRKVFFAYYPNSQFDLIKLCLKNRDKTKVKFIDNLSKCYPVEKIKFAKIECGFENGDYDEGEPCYSIIHSSVLKDFLDCDVYYEDIFPSKTFDLIRESIHDNQISFENLIKLDKKMTKQQINEFQTCQEKLMDF